MGVFAAGQHADQAGEHGQPGRDERRGGQRHGGTEQHRAAVARARSAGRTSASSTAGKAASSPNAAVSLTRVPPNAPASAPRFQQANSPVPQTQYASRRRCGSGWARVSATVSSTIRWVPRTRRSRPVPSTSATAKPNGRCRALTSSPAAIAASGLPPAAMSPMNMNWAAPAKTTTDISTGSQMGRPEPTAMAPNEAPTTATARQMSATVRARSRSSVRHIERIVFYDELGRGVRQVERIDRWSEHG